jgi:hypothetical protein
LLRGGNVTFTNDLVLLQLCRNKGLEPEEKPLLVSLITEFDGSNSGAWRFRYSPSAPLRLVSRNAAVATSSRWPCGIGFLSSHHILLAIP